MTSHHKRRRLSAAVMTAMAVAVPVLPALAAPAAAAPSVTAVANAERAVAKKRVPSMVPSLTVVKQRDHRVKVTWTKPARGPVGRYVLTWSGKKLTVGSGTRSATLTGLSNSKLTQIFIRAGNGKGLGTKRGVLGHGAGAPVAPSFPLVALNGGQAVISWSAVAPNGPGPTTYRVLSGGRVVCTWQARTSCTTSPLPGDAYAVQARNAEETSKRESGTPGHHVSARSASTPVPTDVPTSVTVGKGSPCGGGGGGGCGGPCSNSSCAKVRLVVTGTSGGVSCSLASNAPGDPFPNRFVTSPYDGQPGWYMGYPGYWLQATCAGVVSNKYYWPSGSSAAKTVAKPKPKKPSAVRNLRVTRQADRAVKVAWSKPAKGTGITKYRVTWTGAGKTVAVSSKARSFVVTGLTNGQTVRVAVAAVNKKGSGPAAKVVGLAAGRPGTPAAPTFVLENRGGASGKDSKAVTVQVNQVSPNGSGPVQYQFLRGDVVVCTWQTSTQCSEDLANNGQTVSYRVQARNAQALAPKPEDPAGSHVSPLSATRAVVLSATPDTPVITSLVPTGSNNQVQLAFTAGKSYGASNTVECQVTGGSCGPFGFGPAGGASGTKSVTGPANGTTATLQLRACNGVDGSGPGSSRCSPWTSATVTPYGPIGQPSINVGANGQTITGSYTWNANGKSATVTVTRNDGQVLASFTSAGSGTNAISDTVGIAKTYTYTITVSDPGRATTSASAGASTSAQAVTVSKGSNCGGGGGPGCGGVCSNSSCAKVRLTTQGFPGNVTCSLNTNASGDPFPSRTVAGTYDGEPGWYMGYPGKWLQATCNGVVSNQYYWPN